MLYNIKKLINDSAMIDLSNEEINYLIEEEKQAVQDYKQAIEMTSDSKVIYVLSHILKEEAHHIELLEQLRDGKIKFEDSIEKITLRLNKAQNEYNEYVVKCYINGKFDESGCYYTDDWNDAVDTFYAMAENLRLDTKQSGNTFLAESK